MGPHIPAVNLFSLYALVSHVIKFYVKINHITLPSQNIL